MQSAFMYKYLIINELWSLTNSKTERMGLKTLLFCK